MGAIPQSKKRLRRFQEIKRRWKHLISKSLECLRRKRKLQPNGYRSASRDFEG